MAVASHTRTRNRQFSFRYAGVIALTFAICLSIPVAAAASISSPLCTAQTESRGLLGVAATDAPAVFVATDFTSTVHRYAASGNQDWVLQLENYVTPSSIEIAYSTDGNVLRISGQQRVVSSESNQWLYEVNPISGAVLKNKTIVVPAVGIQDDPTRAVLTAVFYGDTPAGIFPRPTYGYPVYYDVFPANVHFTEKDFNGSLYSIVPTKQPFVFAAFASIYAPGTELPFPPGTRNRFPTAPPRSENATLYVVLRDTSKENPKYFDQKAKFLLPNPSSYDFVVPVEIISTENYLYATAFAQSSPTGTGNSTFWAPFSLRGPPTETLDRFIVQKIKQSDLTPVWTRVFTSGDRLFEYGASIDVRGDVAVSTVSILQRDAPSTSTGQKHDIVILSLESGSGATSGMSVFDTSKLDSTNDIVLLSDSTVALVGALNQEPSDVPFGRTPQSSVCFFARPTGIDSEILGDATKNGGGSDTTEPPTTTTPVPTITADPCEEISAEANIEASTEATAEATFGMTAAGYSSCS